MKNPKAFLEIAADYGHKDKCSLGKHCYGAEGSPIVNFFKGPLCKLIIGNFVSFGSNVTILVGGEHFTEYVSTYPFSDIFDDVSKIECVKTKGDIIIGSDVWIGYNTLILSGVKIGHGAVIGARSVVSKDVEPYTIVAGNPIREIRKRFTEKQREKLLEIKWWEWEDERIDKFIPLLMNKDIDNFIRLVDEVREVKV